MRIKKKISNLYYRLFCFRFRGQYRIIHGLQRYKAPSFSQAKVLKRYLRDGENNSLHRIFRLLRNAHSSAGFYIVDIGGNVGYTAIHYLNHNSTTAGNHVIIFEPSSFNRGFISYNLRKYKNWILFPFALGEETKRVSIGMPEYVTDLHKDIDNTGFYQLSNGVVEGCEDCFLTSLDSVSCNLPEDVLAQIKFVKIDVEGMELGVLVGGEGFLKKTRPVVQIEFNANTTDIDELIRTCDWMSRLGFGAYSEEQITSESRREEIYFVPDGVEEYADIIGAELQRVELGTIGKLTVS